MKPWLTRIAAGLALLAILGGVTFISLSAMGAGVWLWLGTEHDIALEPLAATRELFDDHEARQHVELMKQRLEAERGGIEAGDEPEDTDEDGVAEADDDRPRPTGEAKGPAYGTGPRSKGAVRRNGRGGRGGSGSGSGSGSGGSSGRGGSSGDGNGADDDDDGGSSGGKEGSKPKEDDKDSGGGGSSGGGSSDCDISGVTQVSSTRYELTESFRSKYIKDSSKAQKQGKGAWAENRSGDTVGIEVWKLKCAPRAAGLRDDDIIRVVAGKEMTGTWNAWQAYGKVKKDDSFNIKITRDGEKMTLKYTVK